MKTAALLVFGATFLSCAWACATRRPPPPGASGPVIYEYQNCANCHGEDLKGNSLGPSLDGIAEHWERADLIRFLEDPEPFVESVERLRALDREYSANMNPYANLTVAERGVLADWLLGR